jgi:RNA polymerase sigma-70 factor (ECF subfamily)
MTAGTQQALLERALHGETQALGELLQGLRPYVRFLVRAVRRGRLPNRLDDSDLIQDALVEVHRHFPRFHGQTVADLLSWLRPIVVRAAGHTLRGHLCTAQRDPGREQAEADLDALVADPDSSPSGQAIRQEQTLLLAEALGRLPEDMQQVLLGRHADGLAHAELAQRLGRSEAAVRVLYTRAVRRLREEYEQHNEPGPDTP